jgi:hypothetical protein
MKICVIDLKNAAPEVVFQDERLGNLRRLMDVGLYGLLAGIPKASWPQVSPNESASSPKTIGEYLAQNGKNTVVAESPAPGAKIDISSDQWVSAKKQMADGGWDGFCLVDAGLSWIAREENSAGVSSSDYYLWLDEQIGSMMEMLDEQTIFLVISDSVSEKPGLFLMAAPNCPINGEHEGASVSAIAPTLLDLAGYEMPESVQALSLVAGMEKRVPGEEDHEKIIFDRLAGLGYV